MPSRGGGVPRPPFQCIPAGGGDHFHLGRVGHWSRCFTSAASAPRRPSGAGHRSTQSLSPACSPSAGRTRISLPIQRPPRTLREYVPHPHPGRRLSAGHRPVMRGGSGTPPRPTATPGERGPLSLSPRPPPSNSAPRARPTTSPAGRLKSLKRVSLHINLANPVHRPSPPPTKHLFWTHVNGAKYCPALRACFPDPPPQFTPARSPPPPPPGVAIHRGPIPLRPVHCL